jgi:hypothetical protein
MMIKYLQTVKKFLLFAAAGKPDFMSYGAILFFFLPTLFIRPERQKQISK